MHTGRDSGVGRVRNGWTRSVKEGSENEFRHDIPRSRVEAKEIGLSFSIAHTLLAMNDVMMNLRK